MRVTTAEFISNFGSLTEIASAEPVTITKYGRDRLVLVSADEYDRLMRRDRRAFRAEELNEDDIALIAKTEVPSEYAYLDQELTGWQP